MNFSELPSPCYIVDEAILDRNLSVLKEVQDRTSARIILALKGFAMHRVFPQIKTVLGGTTASSVHEARLGREIFGGEVHAYAPAYSDQGQEAANRFASLLIANPTRTSAPGWWARPRAGT